MDSAQAWRDTFVKWPEEVKQRGVLITTFGEQIPFVSFMTNPEILLLQRGSPDALGARMVLVSYNEISALKITDPLDSKAVEAMGFQGKLAKL